MGGHRTSLLHIEKQQSKEGLCRAIGRLGPDLIGFSATTNQYPYVQLFSKWIRERFDIPIICGGFHATLSPDEVISDGNIDIVCIGEGEYPMLELANKVERGECITDIRNLWVKAKGDLYRNPIRPLIENLDELPFPDRDLFGYDRLLKKFRYNAEIITARGCPFNCSYCCNHALRKLYQGSGVYFRRRSVDNVLNEFEDLAQRYKVDFLYFNDETFTLRPEWVEEFCGKYPKRFTVPFQCNAFPTTLNRRMVYQLKEAGCSRISMGIESGNEWLRKTVLKRPITNNQLIKAFELLNEGGIRSYAFSMVGLPYETPEMIDDTIRLNLALDPSHIQVSVFYPYPGTHLYEICKENGWLTQDQKSSYFGGETVLNLPTLTTKQIKCYYRKLYALSLPKVVHTLYPRIYPFYRLAERLIGKSLTHRITLLARKLKYHY